MNQDPNGLCDDAEMLEIVALAEWDSAGAIAAAEQALIAHPNDARLHFLRGSLLIGEKRFILAHAALSRAIVLDPEFHLARFQLGFFELTSGEAEAAQATWQPLANLPESSFLRKFVEGLNHLIADRFEPCIAELRAGIALNAENLPLNADMELIIARCEDILGGSIRPSDADSAPISATSLLLGSMRQTKQ